MFVYVCMYIGRISELTTKEDLYRYVRRWTRWMRLRVSPSYRSLSIHTYIPTYLFHAHTHTQTVFMSGDYFKALSAACPETEDGVMVVTSGCWKSAGLDQNPTTQLQALGSGAKITRKFAKDADPNQGGMWYVDVDVIYV